jgi:hypothetical protein
MGLIWRSIFTPSSNLSKCGDRAFEELSYTHRDSDSYAELHTDLLQYWVRIP